MERIAIGKSEAFDARWKDGTRAVVKFSKQALPNGKTRQRGIPTLSHPQREVAFWRLALLFGWDDVVPETVLLPDLDGRVASAQAWIPAAPLSSFRKGLKNHRNPNWVGDFVAAAALVPKTDWAKIVLLDVIAGARDRHANNVGIRVLLDENTISHGVVAWDNAVSFGKTFYFYHEVFHKLLFPNHFHLDTLWAAIERVRDADIREAISEFISPEEVEHACVRRGFLEAFPHRMPWSIISQGTVAASDFPSYERLFTEALEGLSFFPTNVSSENVVVSS